MVKVIRGVSGERSVWSFGLFSLGLEVVICDWIVGLGDRTGICVFTFIYLAEEDILVLYVNRCKCEVLGYLGRFYNICVFCVS